MPLENILPLQIAAHKTIEQLHGIGHKNKSESKTYQNMQRGF